MGARVLALSPGAVPLETEPWTVPDLLGYAKAEESIDLHSVCVVASQILFLLSGRRFGVRTETVRPLAVAVNPAVGLDWSSISARAMALRTPSEGVMNSYALTTVPLNAPVQSVASVLVDGVTVDPSEYAIYDRRTLVRLPDATGTVRPWPLYQNIERPLTEAGTMAVTYQWGTPVPEGGKLAAQVFATELAKYINKDSSALPDRTVTVTRQGVTQTVLDPSQFIRQARTGLYLVDIWLGSVNPDGNRKRSTITSPETIQQARRT